MDSTSDDFFDTFKNVQLSTTKKFCFKKVKENKTETVVKSPFFKKLDNLKNNSLSTESSNQENSVFITRTDGVFKTIDEKKLKPIINASSNQENTVFIKRTDELFKAIDDKKLKPVINRGSIELCKDHLKNNGLQVSSVPESTEMHDVEVANQSDMTKFKIGSKPISDDNSSPTIFSQMTCEKNTEKIPTNCGNSGQKCQNESKLQVKNDKVVSSKSTISKTRSVGDDNKIKSIDKSPTREIKTKQSPNTCDKLSLKTKLNSNEISSTESSPVVRPKKFTFKRKGLPSSRGTKSSSELDSATSLTTLSQNNVLDDKVIEINSSLETTEADFMDDIQFEKLFGQSNIEQPGPSNKIPPTNVIDFNIPDVDWADNFNTNNLSQDNNILKELSYVNWDEDDFPQEKSTEFTAASHSTARQDDSEEFRKSYPHSGVMIEVLHQKFGLRTFRPHQQEIINASLMQHDCFVLMPTGGGKSLCYQLPAILMPGVTIVISPLRALISDQVDKLNALDIPSAHMCSDVSKTDTEVILSKLHIREPIIKLLYLTPEKIVASRNVTDLIKSLYQRGKLARFVIDEAHCLSQWGHDFRPDYKQLAQLRKQYPDVPIICLTATATKQVEIDVIHILGLKNVKRFIRSFNRPNIKYQVLPKTGKSVVNEIADIIKKKFHKKSGIIYCLCRADCDKLAGQLNQMGIKAKSYHAGMSDKVRETQQRQWMQDQFHVIVATIAFGMGIDKPDVRFVIHNSIPKSVEAFYQESGRAGRDGETSYSYLFYSYTDVGRLQRLMRMDKNVKKTTLDGHFENLRQMVSYAENIVDCRRHLQLLHLGEKFDRQICIDNKETTCDNCENINKYKTIDVTQQSQELAQLVKDISSRENVTLLHIADVYKGSKLKKILDKQHNLHKFYGSGANLDRSDIHRILKDLMLKRILADFCTYTGEFPVVYIKPGSNFNSVIKPDANFTISVVHSHKATNIPKLDVANVDKVSENESKVEFDTPLPSTSKPKLAPVTKLQLSKIQVSCHEELLEECRRLAIERNVTLSSIMNLSAIKSMSDILPKSKEEFMKIQHVTNANYDKFGDFFLKITKKYGEQLDKLQQVQTVQSLPNSANQCTNDNDDWSTSFIPKSVGVKRKSSGNNYKSGGKRFKKYRRKAGKKSPKTSPKKKKGGYTKKAGGGKLGLMPLHFH